MAHDARPVYFTNGPNGEIPAVQLTGSNVAIASGVLSATSPSVEVNPIDGVKNVMIAMNPHGFFENMNYQMVFEHFVPGLGWMLWHGGDGTPVELLYSTESPAVFGPYQGFPAFDKGRIRILGAGGGSGVTYNAFKNGTYSSSVEGNRLPEAFDEDIETNFSIAGAGPTRSNPVYVSVDVGFDVLPTLFTMYGRDGSSTVEEFELQGQDGDNWDVLIDDILLRNNTTQEWNITTSKKYRNYRIAIKSTHASLDVRMHDVRLYVPAEGDIDVSVWAVR